MAKDKQSSEEGGKGRNQGRYKKELYIVLCCVVLCCVVLCCMACIL